MRLCHEQLFPPGWGFAQEQLSVSFTTCAVIQMCRVQEEADYCVMCGKAHGVDGQGRASVAAQRREGLALCASTLWVRHNYRAIEDPPRFVENASSGSQDSQEQIGYSAGARTCSFLDCVESQMSKTGCCHQGTLALPGGIKTIAGVP